MNPEISSFIEKELANDTNPPQPAPELKGPAVAAKYIEEEGAPLQEAIATEHAALEAKRAETGAEYEGELRGKLELAFKEAVDKALFNAELDMTTDDGRREYARLEAHKDAIVNATLAKMSFEKTPIDQAEKILLEIWAQNQPESKEATA